MVRLTANMMERAKSQGYAVDTLVRVGGSASIPLIRQLLEEKLQIPVRRTQHQDMVGYCRINLCRVKISRNIPLYCHVQSREALYLEIFNTQDS